MEGRRNGHSFLGTIYLFCDSSNQSLDNDDVCKAVVAADDERRGGAGRGGAGAPHFEVQVIKSSASTPADDISIA